MGEALISERVSYGKAANTGIIAWNEPQVLESVTGQLQGEAFQRGMTHLSVRIPMLTVTGTLHVRRKEGLQPL